MHNGYSTPRSYLSAIGHKKRVARGKCRRCGAMREQANRLMCNACLARAVEDNRKRIAAKSPDLCSWPGCQEKRGKTKMCEMHRRQNNYASSLSRRRKIDNELDLEEMQCQKG